MAKNKTKAKFKCKRCGRCCLQYGSNLQASEKEIKEWKRKKREDILSRVRVIKVGNGLVVGYDLWFNPKTGKDLPRCPFLRKEKNKKFYSCTIYDIRPEVCRNFPVSKNHALKVGCRGYIE